MSSDYKRMLITRFTIQNVSIKSNESDIKRVGVYYLQYKMFLLNFYRRDCI